MKTLKELKALKSVRVKRVACGMDTIEDIPKIRDTLKAAIATEFGVFNESEFKESDHDFSYQGYAWLKPKCTKEQDGIITFRSKDYVFNYGDKSSYGPDLKSEMLTDYGFKIPTIQGGFFEYHILGGINE